MINLKGLSIFVTGGTGSFGTAIVDYLKDSGCHIIVYSRDETKQFDMRNERKDRDIEYIIGDIRDKDKLIRSMKGVDYVAHAAAYKHVSTGELFPEEVIATNIIGTKNVIEASEYCGVKRLVDLSTDKSVRPYNTYGMSKSIAEKLVLAHKGNMIAVCLRYGNVLGSRGSIIPIFKRLIANKEPLTITNPLASRFVLTLQDAVNLALKCLTDGDKGDLFIMRPPACTVDSIVKAFELYYSKDLPKKIIGMKSGEKMHEVLLTGDEVRRSIIEREGDITYARVKPIDTNNYYKDNENYEELPDYSSANAEQLTPIQVLNKLQEANLL